MLIKDFYRVIESAKADEKIEVKIQLNPDHEVYEGHFKGQPVVPGVIQLQIIKELIEKWIGKSLFMNNTVQVKYLIPIVPDGKLPIDFQITKLSSVNGKIRINAVVSISERVATKVKIEFAVEK